MAYDKEFIRRHCGEPSTKPAEDAALTLVDALLFVVVVAAFVWVGCYA